MRKLVLVALALCTSSVSFAGVRQGGGTGGGPVRPPVGGGFGGGGIVRPPMGGGHSQGGFGGGIVRPPMGGGHSQGGFGGGPVRPPVGGGHSQGGFGGGPVRPPVGGGFGGGGFGGGGFGGGGFGGGGFGGGGFDPGASYGTKNVCKCPEVFGSYNRNLTVTTHRKYDGVIVSTRVLLFDISVTQCYSQAESLPVCDEVSWN